MGILDSLFGGSKGPSPKQVASRANILRTRHGEPARRYEAADRLSEWGTPECLDGLLGRFAMNAASETSDEEEKAYVARLVEKAGEAVVPVIERYLRDEAEVNWPLRILSNIVPAEEYRRRVCAVLASFDVQFDRIPDRKVAMIHALEEHRDDPDVARTVATFLEDTDDPVVIAAAEMLASTGDAAHLDSLVEVLLASEDRPRVRAELCRTLAEHGASVKGRKADVEPHLPDGYYLTREGVVKRLTKPEA